MRRIRDLEPENLEPENLVLVHRHQGLPRMFKSLNRRATRTPRAAM
ncbi:MAG: hypothetical protein AVDCRST_MAG28-1105 [uncultured Rubrobacteraceae bacterium]|uniref:Uncharacterized protein n=1 Tax=uncultured Rubrobacteraceae bacterium TaxID=349277 RepID=A0A6J4QLX6_9ACTN|nr:MAG: hypothetical protein AVDCRST_MAG28-1105 [uncultured Rubrobacteraceae bacterium]